MADGKTDNNLSVDETSQFIISYPLLESNDNILGKIKEFDVNIDDFNKFILQSLELADIQIDLEKFIEFQFTRFIAKIQLHNSHAIELTQDYLSEFNSDYNIWFYRKYLLENFWTEDIIRSEFDFLFKILNECPKIFQIYSYRRWFVHFANENQLYNLDKDLERLKEVLLSEDNNYMLWQHINFIATSFNHVEYLIELTKEIMMRDKYNSSPYYHRMYAFKLLPDSVDYSEEIKFLESLEIDMNHPYSEAYEFYRTEFDDIFQLSSES
ncbi:MAG: CAAX geranylgeranyltransferase alpha subunit [Marteilia pararefringens]